MTNQESLHRVEERQELFERSRIRLEHLSFRAVQKGLRLDQFVAICAEVDDPAWTDVVDIVLMPGQNWQPYRDRGEIPIAKGTYRTEVLDIFREMVPDIKPALEQDLPLGFVRAIILGAGGASVYLIEPTEHKMN